MKITKQELIELKACKEGLARFIAQTNNTDKPVEVSSLVGGENTYEDLLWLAGEKLLKERIVRFTCDCALLNIKLIEPYTNKYNLIVEFLRNPTTDIADTARDAAFAAVTAAENAGDTTAYSAAYSATHASRAAARTAIYAANSIRATRAARAAGHAAYAAARAGSGGKVDELLRELFA